MRHLRDHSGRTDHHRGCQRRRPAHRRRRRSDPAQRRAVAAQARRDRPCSVTDTDLSCARCHRAARLTGTPRAPAERGRRGATVAVSRRWPEGYVCSGCFVKACETFGRCASCGADQLVPGIGATGPLCADYAGLGDYFTCHRCGEEGCSTAPVAAGAACSATGSPPFLTTEPGRSGGSWSRSTTPSGVCGGRAAALAQQRTSRRCAWATRRCRSPNPSPTS
jgi:hypothetical protein